MIAYIGSREMRTEDGYIVYECINGDKSAFALLIDKYKAAVFAIAYSKLFNFQDAEDVTQEAFIKAYQKLNNLKHYDKFIVWLHSITNNLCKDFIRSRSRRPDREFIEDQEPLVLDTPSLESYKDNLVNELIHDALNSLPEIYRQVLSLHYLGGMKDVEIAEFLGMSHTNVRQKLMKARTLLKEEMLLMMNATFEGQKLQASFTFRIVEMVKRIKIQPVSTMKGLPWGLSLATGLIITFLSLNPYIPQPNQLGVFSGSPLLSETKVLKVGEIPVDVVKTSNLAIISSNIGNDKSGESEQPDMQNAFMAPQAEGDTWVKKADMPTARGILSTSVVDGKIYAIGGYAANGMSIKTVEKYDPAKDAWTKKTDMPTARNWFSTSVVDGKIYAIGGGSEVVIGFSTVEIYDPATDTWTKGSDMPTGRRGLSTSVVNGKIYAIGGDNRFGPSLSTVEEYDPVKDIWTEKSDMPTGRAGLSTSVVNGEIYAIGGIPVNTQWWKALSTLEVYNPTTDTWIKKTDMPTPRNSPSSCVVNGKIYVIGGELAPPSTDLSTVEVYDPVIDEWMKKADMLTIRGAPSASVVDRKIYVIGGFSMEDVLSTVEEYTPEGWSFAVSSKGKLPSIWGWMKQKE
jgi:RNA polymerase sigma factor (sigma-70 family)